MRCHAGTSGFSYDAWKGPFYPEGLKAKDMLAFYASRLETVEINNTFYRLPRASVLEGWAAQVPETFRFVIKASQRITHQARLQGTKETVDYLWQACSALGARLGPILFQLPPNLRADVERLKRFTSELPAGLRAVFEFRHPSWEAAEVHEVLRQAQAALCLSEREDNDADPALVPTADFGYLRLRKPSYSEADLASWVERVRSQPWQEVFVFFKHEDEGIAPRLALRFRELFAETRPLEAR